MFYDTYSKVLCMKFGVKSVLVVSVKTSLKSITFEQGLADFFSEGPDSKYFRPYTSYYLCGSN